MSHFWFVHSKDEELTETTLVETDWVRTGSPFWNLGFPSKPLTACCLVTLHVHGYGKGRHLVGILMVMIKCLLITYASRETKLSVTSSRKTWRKLPLSV